MLENILKLLKNRDYLGESKCIAVAKGHYKIPSNLKEALIQFKRELKWR